MCACVCRWNQLDLAIVLLSIMGITLEEIEVNASLPINPTIIRIMRVLRIARGTIPFLPSRWQSNSSHRSPDAIVPRPRSWGFDFKENCKTATSLGLPSLSSLHGRSQQGSGRGRANQMAYLADKQSTEKELSSKKLKVVTEGEGEW